MSSTSSACSSCRSGDALLLDGIITYTGLFHSREAAFLLTTPASTDRIFAYKFAEAIGFSSWGFFLLGSPLMAAYGIDRQGAGRLLRDVPAIPAVVRLDRGQPRGGRGDHWWRTSSPSGRSASWRLAVIAIVVLLVRWRFGSGERPGDTLTGDWLGGVSEPAGFLPEPAAGRAGGCRRVCWPSARGDWSRSGYYLDGAFGPRRLLLIWPPPQWRARPLLPGLQPGAGRTVSSRRRQAGFTRSTRSFTVSSSSCRRPIRLLILKDLRTFRRDPAQWSQFLIFFGLLAFYFLNIPRLGLRRSEPVLAEPGQLPEPLGHGAHPLDVHQPVHFPAAFAGRAEFLGAGPAAARARADPLGQVRVLGWNLAAGDRGLLVFLSDLMLGMGPVMIALHLGMVAVLCLGLSGISVGLGARLPNLRETRPIQDRRRFRRHAESAGQPGLHLRDRHAHGDTLPPLLPEHRVSRRDQPRAVSCRHPGGSLASGARQPDRRRAGNNRPPTNRNQGIRAHGILRTT